MLMFSLYSLERSENRCFSCFQGEHRPKDFLMFSSGMERDQWHEMGQFLCSHHTKTIILIYKSID